MKELSLEKMENIEGGECTAGEAFSVGLAAVGVGLLFAFPPSAFFIVPAATAAGVGAGQAIANCMN